MKFTLPVLLILWIGLPVTAQDKIERFYDYSWQLCDPSIARYYSVITREDSVWHQQDLYVQEKKLQMNGFYKDQDGKIKHGLFTYFHPNGKLSGQRTYVNNEIQGLYLSYHDNGMIKDSINYKNGKMKGTSKSWYPSGAIKKVMQLDTMGYESGLSLAYFENRQVSEKGRYVAGFKKQGLWSYYHLSGKKASEVTYSKDLVVSKKCLDENEIEQGTCEINFTEAEFSGGKDAFNKYLKKNIYWPTALRFTEPGKAFVLVSFIVDSDGGIIDVKIEQSFQRDFEQIALQAIRKMPPWKPATEFNRKVQQKLVQTIVFNQSN